MSKRTTGDHLIRNASVCQDNRCHEMFSRTLACSFAVAFFPSTMYEHLTGLAWILFNIDAYFHINKKEQKSQQTHFDAETNLNLGTKGMLRSLHDAFCNFPDLNHQ